MGPPIAVALLAVLGGGACGDGGGKPEPVPVEVDATLRSIATAVSGLPYFTANPDAVPEYLRDIDASTSLIETNRQAAFLALSLAMSALVDTCLGPGISVAEKETIRTVILPQFHSLMFFLYEDQWPPRLRNLRDNRGDDCLNEVPEL